MRGGEKCVQQWALEVVRGGCGHRGGEELWEVPGADVEAATQHLNVST
jgi:hypothetical protein